MDIKVIRRSFLCANWKLNHHLPQTLGYLRELITEAQNLTSIDIAVAPVTTVLSAACDVTRQTNIKIAGQNVFFEPAGAYTGEWSAEHLRELGCSYAIIGHSERRQYFAESDESVAKKAKACFKHAILPIICVGETLQERNAGLVESVLNRQVSTAISNLSQDQVASLIIAYEPVWAIGTGLSASCEAAQDSHHLIRKIMSKLFNSAASNQTRIIYGGSVKADNVYELACKPDIDGALVGGASLKSESFLAIAKEVSRAKI